MAIQISSKVKQVDLVVARDENEVGGEWGGEGGIKYSIRVASWIEDSISHEARSLLD